MTAILLINEPPLQVLPTLAVKVGLNEAIILQQIHYWLNPKFNKNLIEGRYWVYNTYDQWQQQFPFWGEKTIRRAIVNLEDSKILLSFITRDFKKIKYYSIDYDILNQFSSSLEISSQNPENLPSGQNDQIDQTELADRAGQDDQIDQDKMTTSYITENTHETTSLIQEEGREKNITNQMRAVWNEKVHTKLNLSPITQLTPKRVKNLMELFESFFSQNLMDWINYCNQIAKTGYLMGNNPHGFKVTLDWAINPDNACKVIEGAYYDSPLKDLALPVEKNFEDFLTDLTKENEGQPHSKLWLAISKHLIKKHGQPIYKSWFAKIKIKEITENTLSFEAPTLFIKDHIATHYNCDLEAAIQTSLPEISQIQYQVAPREVSK